ncbi:MAG: potassium channel family protein, partial [Muribaculaceae bacterium]|nr:potassium channel family protein [Muribaculaceae bacterium]
MQTVRFGSKIKQRHITLRESVYFVLHVAMLVLSLFLILSISIDTFKGIEFFNEPGNLRMQTWICICFLVDFVIEFFMARRKWHYLLTHFVFLLVSVPYLAIIHVMGWTFSANITYLLQFIPLVRGGYALAIVVGWFTYNRATGLFMTYLVTLLATVYFGSLVFYMFEHGVNPTVTDYDSALWWAAMDVTTVGSNIVAVTPVGRILSVVLAALGMMMFPIFTVYVTSLITSKRRNLTGIFGSGDNSNSASDAESDT